MNHKYDNIPTFIRSHVQLEEKSFHTLHFIYKGICSCEKTHMSEKKRNVSMSWKEHDHQQRKSKPSKQLTV